jgi:hypothetical protein
MQFLAHMLKAPQAQLVRLLIFTNIFRKSTSRTCSISLRIGFDGHLDIYRLNFAMITLIPKENDAREMRKFRPISLLN